MMIYLSNLKYLLKHKWYVMKECFKRHEYWLGITHDMSKFLPCEFIPYAKSFYGKTFKWADLSGDIKNHLDWNNSEEGIAYAFDEAWLYHQNKNRHHWQYWVLKNDNGTTKAIEMPEKYAKEMISDWIGAGIAINGHNEVYEWYQNNKEKMILAPYTRMWVEGRINEYRKE